MVCARHGEGWSEWSSGKVCLPHVVGLCKPSEKGRVSSLGALV